MSDTSLLKSFTSSKWKGPLAIGLLHLALSLAAFHGTQFPGGDDATYISLAKSLMQGHGYVDIWDPALHPHTQYPPVFPLIVAGGLLAGLSPFAGLKLMMVFISATTVFVSCLWLRRVSSPAIALCAGLFIAISPEIIRLGQIALSDVPFWLFAILSLLAWRRADNGVAESDGRMPVGWVIAATAATLAAYFTRSAGAPLLLATLIWLLIRRQPRAIAIVLGVSLPLILAWWYRGHAAGAGGYLGPFLSVDPYDPALGSVGVVDLLKRAFANSSTYAARQLSRLVFGNPLHGLEFGIPFVAAMIYGWAARLRKLSLPEIWFPFYVGLVLLWPVTWAGARFLLPIVPLIALYVAETIGAIAKKTSFAKALVALVMMSGVLLVQPTLRQAVRYGAICRDRIASGNEFGCMEDIFGDFLRLAQSTKGKLPENSVVISRKPTLFYLNSGYRSRMYPLYTEPDSLFTEARRIGAHYLVADNISDLAPIYLHPILTKNRDDFCVVPGLSNANAVLMKIEIGGPPRPPGTPPDVFRVCGQP